MNDEDLYRLARELGGVLSAHAVRLVTAESCTGGWIAQCVTDVAGSSAWFECGFVTYSNEAKRAVLGVPPAVLETHGAVSEETVRAMAAGALRVSHADCVVAVSGIAGPGGAVADKPVGTVWFAWERRDGVSMSRRAFFAGDRRAVRRQAVALALQGLLMLYPSHEQRDRGGSLS